MKVLHVCAYAAPYGGNFIKSLLYLDQELNKRNIETIFCFPEKCKTLEWCICLENTHKVYYVPLAKARIKLKTYILLKKIFKENPDILVAHSHFELYDEPLAITAPKQVKVFWHLHDAIGNYLHGIYRLVWKLHYNLFIKNVQLLSVSEKHRRVVVELGFPKERTYYIPNGIDVDSIKPVENLKQDIYTFTIFGWDYIRKGVDLAIKCIRNMNTNAKLVIVTNSRELDAGAKVEYVEPSSDVNDVFVHSSCFLHISRAEGLSYALLEALYSGMPVIVSDIEENLIAKECPTAFYVQSENIEQIGKLMNDFSSKDYKCSEEKISKTRSIIKEKYSLQAWSKAIIQKYGLL